MSQADSQAAVWRRSIERWPEATRFGLIALDEQDSQAAVWRRSIERWPEATRFGLIALDEQDSFSLSLPSHFDVLSKSSGAANTTQRMVAGVIPGSIAASTGTVISNAASTGAFGYLNTFAVLGFDKTTDYPAGGIVTFATNGTLTHVGGGMVTIAGEPLINRGLLDLISCWNSEDSDHSDPGLEDEYKEFELNRLRFCAGS
jgi:hypothetical protein